jgi:hypothetical protein
MNTQEIILKAKEKGLCKDYLSQFKSDNSLKNLCEKYFIGSDWAIEKDFPSLEILRKVKEQTKQYGLFTDHTDNIENVKKVAIFGNSKLDLYANDFSVNEIYIRHDSDVKINGNQYAYMIIIVLDNSKVSIQCLDQSKAVVYVYGNNTKINYVGNVKINYINGL